MPLIGRNPAAGAVFAAIALAVFWPAVSCAQGHASPPSPTPAASAEPAPGGLPVVLDRVVAVINDDVILESDVQEEMRFTDLQGGRLDTGKSAQQSALERLIDRSLILQQIKATQSQIAPPTAEMVKQQVDALRREIPQCAAEQCQTDAGWRAFLQARGLTEEAVDDHWRQRILILAFIQSRFGAGIRISQAEIEDYYRQDLAAEFARRKLPPPPLAEVSSRIQEILLQQRVNTFLDEWLQSLKQEGSVSILDDDSSVAGVAPTPANGNPGGRP
jgi:peptidyl-prolyl cis-trans isomerase SurA